uniref:Uncharacterized protein n=1 Tax=Anopheles atroparvus TaxID=41427 RepID=A0A182JFI9_ANOAO
MITLSRLSSRRGNSFGGLMKVRVCTRGPAHSPQPVRHDVIVLEGFRDRQPLVIAVVLRLTVGQLPGHSRLPPALGPPVVLLFASETDFCRDSIRFAIRFWVSWSDVAVVLLPAVATVVFGLVPVVVATTSPVQRIKVHVAPQPIDPFRLGSLELPQIGYQMHLLFA